jgi:hypothetical protein
MKFPIYSTVLALNVSDQGIVRPSAFAVLELMVNSNVVGTCTGSSAGFIPFKIWSLAAPSPANVRFGGPKRTFGKRGPNRTAQNQVCSGRCAASSAERCRLVERFLGAFRRFFTGFSGLACLGGEGGGRLMFLSRFTKASAISGMSEGPSSGSVCIVASSRSA